MKNKVFVFKAFSDEDTYRTFEIKGDKSLYNLAEIIIKSFDFNFDHAFGFSDDIEDFYSGKEVYELFADMPGCEADEGVKSVKKTFISNVFQPKKQMIFLFDYGDTWIFLIECQDIVDAAPKARYPKITKKVGTAPEQYPDCDEE